MPIDLRINFYHQLNRYEVAIFVDREVLPSFVQDALLPGVHVPMNEALVMWAEDLGQQYANVYTQEGVLIVPKQVFYLIVDMNYLADLPIICLD